MTSGTLKSAGILAMASAFLTLPLVFLSYMLESRTGSAALLVQTVVQLSGTTLFIAIVLYLKMFLNSMFNFHGTDRCIDLLIIACIVTGAVSLGALYYPPLKESFGLVATVILVAQGIVQVQFGYKLLKLPDDLGGMLKSFCYANMATGLLLATVVLIPLSILVSAVSDLMLGTIFFSFSRISRGDDLKRV